MKNAEFSELKQSVKSLSPKQKKNQKKSKGSGSIDLSCMECFCYIFKPGKIFKVIFMAKKADLSVITSLDDMLRQPGTKCLGSPGMGNSVYVLNSEDKNPTYIVRL